MKKIGWLNDALSKNAEVASMASDFDFVVETKQRTYLKEMAIETCSNFIGRSFSQTQFCHMKNKTRQRGEINKMLNIRPNADQTATDFWQSVINKLIRENEVLIVFYDNQLLIADSFIRNEYALYTDTFSNVTVKNFTFTQKVWNMDDVIFLTYNNEPLKKFLDGLTKDYVDLFSTLIESARRNNQIRGSINFDSVQSLDDESTNKTQKFIDKILGAVQSGATAIFPLFRGISYTEYSKGDVKSVSVDDVGKVKRSLIDDVATALGIPTALIHGEMADLDSNMKAFVRFCINPLMKKFEDELNAKIKVGKDEYFKLNGISYVNILEKSDVVDKLVASGAFTRNEVRELFGFERADNPELDEYLITKNYEKAAAETSKGGEKDNEN